MAFRLIPLAAAASLLAACEGPQHENARTGAVLGGLLGAATGAIVAGDRAKGAVIGGGIGAITGAAIGDSLDRQQRELERDLEGTGATVTNTGEELLINLPSEVTFDFDSAVIRPEFVNPLARVGRTLAAYPDSEIEIVGHTDSTGSAAYNDRLSQRRADSVAAAIRRRGVSSRRIIAYGRGEDEPVASNATEEGRAANRRVELIITPLA